MTLSERPFRLPQNRQDLERLDIKALTEALANARIRLDEVNEIAKERQAEYDTAESVLFDKLENAGLQQVRTERGLFRLNDLAWATVEDEAAARAWAEENMPELLLLNRQRLSVLVRRVITGDDQPAGTDPGQLPPGVSFKTSRKISWRRQ